ncbi:MAG TPA: N-acetyltransferase [Candidatus Handelsmanbacteria bacterium]|nr:N-acetyltransferase [Candidatus Handelsmanbacteria bacterium]
MLHKPISRGEIVILWALHAADAQALYVSDDEVDDYTGTSETFTIEQYRAHYQRVEDADDRVDYAISPRDEPDSFVGEVVLNDIDWSNRSANFRLALLCREFFGKGYGSEATRLRLSCGFERLDLYRIELAVYDLDPRAAHVYEKARFVREGLRRDVLYWQERYHSAIVLSILKPDYAKR